jgi:hypothetical protein
MRKISDAAKEALTTQQERSILETRTKLEQALQRLVAGAPLIVKSGLKINAVNLSKEAQVDRATLYRFHQPVLSQLRQHSTRMTVSANATSSISEAAGQQEYRRLAEEAQQQVEALARINYRLAAKIEDLEQLLAAKDETISELRRMLSKNGSVSSVDKLHSVLRCPK